MSTDPLSDERAGGIVGARLGRPPQDLLEAAVVLEAWGGVRSQDALALEAALLPARVEPDAMPARWDVEEEEEGRESIVAEGIGLLVAIVAVATWAGPLSRQLGATTLEQALRVALPLTLGLQWTIRSRYLGRPSGLRCLAEERGRVLLVLCMLLLALALAPHVGVLAAVLVLIWVGGTLLARRGWGLVYAALVAGEAVALAHHVPAARSLVGLATLVFWACVAAVATAPGPAPTQAPGRLRRALAAGAIGTLLGFLLIGDHSLGWGVHGAFPGLALAPSVLGSLWGGYYLWQFHAAVPRGLRGVPLAQANAQIPGGPAMRILLGALARLVGVTTALSLLVLAAAPWTEGTDRPSLFIAFGAVALMCLFVSLHESLGFTRWALTVAAVSLAVELAIDRLVHVSTPGVALAGAGTIGALLALTPLIGQLRSPGRMLATALWIK
ncbi:MAG TPA: hypothetical protein VN635_06950 [Conexibacter sp.]|nr:hypothetical protein [Conexibacter sp.]